VLFTVLLQLSAAHRVAVASTETAGPTSYDEMGTKYSCSSGCTTYQRALRCVDKYTGSCKIPQCQQIQYCMPSRHNRFDFDRNDLSEKYIQSCKAANLVSKTSYGDKLGQCLKQYTQEVVTGIWDPVSFPDWWVMRMQRGERMISSKDLRKLWKDYCGRATCASGGSRVLTECSSAQPQLEKDFCEESCTLFKGV